MNGIADHGKIKVTIALRSIGRKIINLEDVISLLESIDSVDAAWLQRHVVDMQLLPFQDQVTCSSHIGSAQLTNCLKTSSQLRIMQGTDIFLTVHDAGILNLVFMKPHSAVIEVRFLCFVTNKILLSTAFVAAFHCSMV